MSFRSVPGRNWHVRLYDFGRFPFSHAEWESAIATDGATLVIAANNKFSVFVSRRLCAFGLVALAFRRMWWP